MCGFKEPLVTPGLSLYLTERFWKIEDSVILFIESNYMYLLPQNQKEIHSVGFGSAT